MKFFLILLISSLLLAAPSTKEEKAPAPKVRYKSGREHNFDAATIQGSLQRPSISVVTGNETEGNNGLLRLRENFQDRIASDFAEEVQ